MDDLGQAVRLSNIVLKGTAGDLLTGIFGWQALDLLEMLKKEEEMLNAVQEVYSKVFPLFCKGFEVTLVMILVIDLPGCRTSSFSGFFRL